MEKGACHSFLRNTNVLAHALEACLSYVGVRIKCLLRCLSELQHRENYPTVDAIFPAVKHYFFIQNVFKCCQKIVIYLFRLFTRSHRPFCRLNDERYLYLMYAN